MTRRPASTTVVQVAPPSLYGKVIAVLAQSIAAGDLKPGDALPTEGEMCRQYGVSRITVRRAMTELVNRRLVVRKAGVGSFVAGRPGVLREFHLTGMLEDRREFPSRTLLNQTEPAGAEVAAALRLAVGTPVRHLRTLVHRGDTAMTVADAFTQDGPEWRIEEADYQSEMQAVARMGLRLGRRIERAEQVMDAVAADAVLAEQLGLKRGRPVMRVRRTYFSTEAEPIQFIVIRYHPDRYSFSAELLPRTGTMAFEARQANDAAPPGHAEERQATPPRRAGRPRRAEIA